MILFKKPYIYWILVISILYLSFTIYISQFYVSLLYLPHFTATINWFDFLFSVGGSIVIAVLVGINVVGTFVLYKMHKHEKKSLMKSSAAKTASVTSVGAVVGTTTGICTACLGSLFPSFFGLFGITISVASLPLQGKEIQIGLIFILLLFFYFIQKDLRRENDK